MSEPTSSRFGHAWRKMKAAWQGRLLPTFALKHDSLGLVVTRMEWDGRSSSVRVLWDEVDKAVAFKKDCFGYDKICMEFSLRDGSFVSVDEEMAGWSALTTRLSEFLPGVSPFDKWFPVVSQPPFEKNLTTLFERKETPAA